MYPPVPFNSLPYGVLCQIRDKMSAPTLGRIARTNKSMRSLVEKHCERWEEVRLVLSLFSFYNGKDLFRNELSHCRSTIEGQKLDIERKPIQLIARSIILFIRFARENTMSWLKLFTPLPAVKLTHDGLLAFVERWLEMLKKREKSTTREIMYRRGLYEENRRFEFVRRRVGTKDEYRTELHNRSIYLSAISHELVFGEEMVEEVVEYISRPGFRRN